LSNSDKIIAGQDSRNAVSLNWLIKCVSHEFVSTTLRETNCWATVHAKIEILEHGRVESSIGEGLDGPDFLATFGLHRDLIVDTDVDTSLGDMSLAGAEQLLLEIRDARADYGKVMSA